MKALSWLQLLGGIWGMIIFMIGISNGNTSMLIGVPFFALSITAGYFMLIKHKLCIKLTLINYSLQLIKLKALGVVFYYYSGLGVYLNISPQSFGFNMKYGGGLIAGLTGTNTPIVSINILALSILLIIINLRETT